MIIFLQQMSETWFSQQTCLCGCISYKVAGFQKAGHESCQASKRLGVETVLLPCTLLVKAVLGLPRLKGVQKLTLPYDRATVCEDRKGRTEDKLS